MDFLLPKSPPDSQPSDPSNSTKPPEALSDNYRLLLCLWFSFCVVTFVWFISKMYNGRTKMRRDFVTIEEQLRRLQMSIEGKDDLDVERITQEAEERSQKLVEKEANENNKNSSDQNLNNCDQNIKDNISCDKGKNSCDQKNKDENSCDKIKKDNSCEQNSKDNSCDQSNKDKTKENQKDVTSDKSEYLKNPYEAATKDISELMDRNGGNCTKRGMEDVVAKVKAVEDMIEGKRLQLEPVDGEPEENKKTA